MLQHTIITKFTISAPLTVVCIVQCVTWTAVKRPPVWTAGTIRPAHWLVRPAQFPMPHHLDLLQELLLFVKIYSREKVRILVTCTFWLTPICLSATKQQIQKNLKVISHTTYRAFKWRWWLPFRQVEGSYQNLRGQGKRVSVHSPSRHWRWRPR